MSAHELIASALGVNWQEDRDCFYWVERPEGGWDRLTPSEFAARMSDLAWSDSASHRLEYLRTQLRAECISYGELAELEDLAEHIEPGDVELLEAAGVPEICDVSHTSSA